MIIHVRVCNFCSGKERKRIYKMRGPDISEHISVLKRKHLALDRERYTQVFVYYYHHMVALCVCVHVCVKDYYCLLSGLRVTYNAMTTSLVTWRSRRLLCKRFHPLHSYVLPSWPLQLTVAVVYKSTASMRSVSMCNVLQLKTRKHLLLLRPSNWSRKNVYQQMQLVLSLVQVTCPAPVRYMHVCT